MASKVEVPDAAAKASRGVVEVASRNKDEVAAAVDPGSDVEIGRECAPIVRASSPRVINVDAGLYSIDAAGGAAGAASEDGLLL